MSSRALQWAFANEELRGTARNVLLAICDDPYATPDEIAAKANVRRATLTTKLRELREAGWLLPDNLPNLALDGGGVGGVVPKAPEQASLGDAEGDGGLGEGGDDAAATIARVWDHYVQTMKPRNRSLGVEEKRIIRDALKVATADECIAAISSCRRSAFHMGHNDRKRKYNTLSQILRGKRGRQTTRERIDFFLGLEEKDGRSELLDGVPSEQRAMFQQRILDVQRGHRLGSDEAVQRAEESEAWLRQRGIEVRRGQDGFPSFHRANP